MQQKINAYWSASADNYDKIINDELNSFRAEVWTSQILENSPDKEVLDILDAGCGPGFFSILLAHAGHRVIGVDGAVRMLQRAKENADKYRVSPTFYEMDCHHLKFSDGIFDVVVSRNLTHALREHETVYREWKRVLRPGGILMIFDANWHLPRVDKALLAETIRREDECIRIYGTTFNGTKRDSDAAKTGEPHQLGSNVRPQWDIALLEQVGFHDVYADKDIIEHLWDPKEKLLYGATPMFMIRAMKF
jgi:SAM-dependent methyltransferase